HPADGSHRPHEGRQQLAPSARTGGERVSAATALGGPKPRESRPAEMAHHPLLSASQQPFTGNADTRKKEIERPGAALANPAGRAEMF
ncbi:MAG: hypothetical protein M3037_11860, partial [Gemmatimonadota bacterium]|nr:hypothetical protein [Gemmatimonadota bacterium]